MRTLLTLALALLASAASAQTQPTSPTCFGDIATVRVSLIKPGGTIQGFMRAVEMHKAWYRANGVNDNDIVAARVLLRDEKTGQPTRYSDTEVMSFHLRPPAPSRTPNKNDAAWQAFLKQYKDNSDLKTEYWACVPKFR